jgi:hypothetical protein
MVLCEKGLVLYLHRGVGYSVDLTPPSCIGNMIVMDWRYCSNRRRSSEVIHSDCGVTPHSVCAYYALSPCRCWGERKWFVFGIRIFGQFHWRTTGTLLDVYAFGFDRLKWDTLKKSG